MTTPLGKYKLVKLIAAGGMAEVYLARQAGAAGFEKQVCLKRILPHLARDKQFVDMFLNEARLASQLDHPNIVSIFDLGEANGNYFIAMEFIDGPNLRGVAKRAAELNEFLPLAEVLKIIAQAAAGLQYAHDLADRDGHPLGLVHRDISPDNILVHRNGTAKVVDFGIAKAANSAGHTRTGTLKGKVAYMPPEQLRGEPLDRRTDVFALGVVLYELITGRRPWEADNEVALIGQIMTADAPLLSELRPDAPEELVAIVHKALAKDRDLRYQSCNELLADLEALIVQMGQSITQSRLADFVRAYSPAKQEDANDGTNELSSIEEQTFGTGMAPAIGASISDSGPVSGGGRSDPAGTMVMAPPAEPPKSNAILFGIIAFLLLAGAVGSTVWYTQQNKVEEPQPIEVERVTAAVKPPPPPVIKPPDPVAPVAPVVVEKTPDPAPAKRRIAKIEPSQPVQQQPVPPPPVVVQQISPPVQIIREAPPAPPPVIAAKGELMVQTRPWAKLVIDGREAGQTPLEGPIKLTAGPHTVKMSNPQLGKEVTRDVQIVAGETQTLRENLNDE